MNNRNYLSPKVRAALVSKVQEGVFTKIGEEGWLAQQRDAAARAAGGGAADAVFPKLMAEIKPDLDNLRKDMDDFRAVKDNVKAMFGKVQEGWETAKQGWSDNKGIILGGGGLLLGSLLLGKSLFGGGKKKKPYNQVGYLPPPYNYPLPQQMMIPRAFEKPE
jgi:hypothetical protein